VSKAAKRERQRQNRELARQERERHERRRRRFRALRAFLVVFVPVAVVFAVVVIVRGGDDGGGAGGDGDGRPAAGAVRCTDRTPERRDRPDVNQTAPAQTLDPAKDYVATIRTSCGTIVARLDPKQAPVATNNFVHLARQGFYDGLTWHRAATGFVIQGGDPAGDGTGGPGYQVVGELPTDGYPVGSLAAAKAGSDPAGSFGSQFFIVTGRQGTTLPAQYTRFGKVVRGLAVARKIESFAPESGDGPPKRTLYIFKIEISESAPNEPSSTTAPASSAP
jgi:cyclophilin family peptidyl-prolyl cis-trans isomerase